MADCMQFLSENHLNACHIFGRLPYAEVIMVGIFLLGVGAGILPSNNSLEVLPPENIWKTTLQMMQFLAL